jgi:RNA polymerase sigma-70 factor (ECF subfamily)
MTVAASDVIEFPSSLPRAREGDHDAFATLVRTHEAMVYSLAWNFFGDRSKAEEVAQDVFLQLYRNLDTIESDSHLLFWLRQVTVRRCIDVKRRVRFKAVPLDEAEAVTASSRQRDPLLDRRLRRHLGELPEIQRAVVTLRYQEDLDPSDICRLLDLPVNTVKSHLHRAVQALRRKLEKQ